jgi:cell division septal protein FtsQ
MDRKELRQRKRRKRRIFFLFIWTLLLFLLLSTTTYAWFTVNRVVSIDSLDIKVNAKGGLTNIYGCN